MNSAETLSDVVYRLSKQNRGRNTVEDAKTQHSASLRACEGVEQYTFGGAHDRQHKEKVRFIGLSTKIDKFSTIMKCRFRAILAHKTVLFRAKFA